MVGALITCPLEVVKVRLQSSQNSSLHNVCSTPNNQHVTTVLSHVIKSRLRKPNFIQTNKLNDLFFANNKGSLMSKINSFKSMFNFFAQSKYIQTKPVSLLHLAKIKSSSSNSMNSRFSLNRSLIFCSLVDIIHNEGFRALFKGIVPTLMGVLPSRFAHFIKMKIFSKLFILSFHNLLKKFTVRAFGGCIMSFFGLFLLIC